MSTNRLGMITTVPVDIKKAFLLAPPPLSPEGRLWRERAARMTLDALGHTNLTVKPNDHNEAVRYARRWFRQFYADADLGEKTDDAQANFECAGIVFEVVRDSVLATDPILFDVPGDDEDEIDV